MGQGNYKKNDIVSIVIEDIGNDGEGIGRADGYTLFVKDAVIGDTVEVRITKCKKNYGYGRVEKVVTPSPFRVVPRCPCHRQCGGCQIQAMQYERQLAYKQDKVRENLLRIGGFSPAEIDGVMEPIVGMEEPWHYRNKAQFPVGYDREGNLIAGFYAGRTHDIIANTDCLLGPAENKMILEAVLSYMRENRVSAYRESEGEGLVRHVLIRTGFYSGEIMVCLVINGKRLPAEDKLVEKLTGVQLVGMALTDDCGQAAIGDEVSGSECEQAASREQENVGKRIVSICVSVNTEKTNVIMGKEIRVLWGNGWIEDSLRVLDAADFGIAGSAEQGLVRGEERITFRISPLSFYQVNPRQTEKLYSLALQYAELTGKETVCDLYCGIGTISLFMARRAGKVYGVEAVPQAIEDARENAGRNRITNVEFCVGKAEEVLPAFYNGKGRDGGSEAEEVRHPDVIVVDPPRKGCDEMCLETMIAMQPERIVYVSCDPATLARDLKILCQGGYEIRKVRAVDQFGHTCHTECACQLVRKTKADGTVEKEAADESDNAGRERRKINYREEEISDCGCIYG